MVQRKNREKKTSDEIGAGGDGGCEEEAWNEDKDEIKEKINEKNKKLIKIKIKNNAKFLKIGGRI